jgi:hypothetical protein
VPPLVSTGSITANNPGGFDDPAQQVLFGGSELGAHTRSGARATLGYWFTDDHCLGVEGGFLVLGRQTDSFDASSILGNPILVRPIMRPDGTAAVELVSNPQRGAFPSPGFLPGTGGSIDAHHTSSFWGAELNLRSDVLCGPNGYIDLVGGYRMLGLDEGLTINESVTSLSTDPAFNAANPNNAFGTVRSLTDSFQTRNRFYGGQLGLVGEYRMDRWVFGGSAKLALGTTQQIVDIAGFQVGNGVPTAGGLLAGVSNIGRHSHSDFSIVPEVGVTVGYQFTERLRGYVGYNFLSWSGVTRPGNQIDLAVSPPNGQTPTRPIFLVHESTFWAQGMTFGLEYRF